jgi:hypothetical protein
MIIVSSRHRKIVLKASPPEGIELCMLGVPIGSTDVQVLEWAKELLEPEAFAELQEVIEREALED